MMLQPAFALGGRTGRVSTRWQRVARQQGGGDYAAVYADRFRAMAAEHESWIASLFGSLGDRERREMMRLLAKTKLSVRHALAEEAP